MKTMILLLLTLTPRAALVAAEDCAKNADACSGGGARLSPFVAASLDERRPPAASAGRRAELKPAPPAPRAPEQAAVSTASAAAPEAAPAGEKLSSPLWLLFVGGALALLYFYLGSKRKGRRK